MNMLSQEEIEDAVYHYFYNSYPPSDWNAWAGYFLRAICVLGDNPQTQDLLRNWSSRDASKFSEKTFQNTYKNSRHKFSNYDMAVGSFIKEAKEYGWTRNKKNYQKNNLNSAEIEELQRLRSLELRDKAIEDTSKIVEEYVKQAQKATNEFNYESNLTQHKYLEKKQIDLKLFPQLKIRYNRKQCNGQWLDSDEKILFMPLQDVFTHKIVNYQRIFETARENGVDKLFLPNAKVNGTCFFLNKFDPKNTILIGEGFATMASIYQALDKNQRDNFSVICAVNAGNLILITQAIRVKSPNSRIIICADNDYVIGQNPNQNTGITKAKEAVAKTYIGMNENCILIPPPIIRPNNDCKTDFNDIYCESLPGCGPKAIQKMIIEKNDFLENQKNAFLQQMTPEIKQQKEEKRANYLTHLQFNIISKIYEYEKKLEELLNSKNPKNKYLPFTNIINNLIEIGILEKNIFDLNQAAEIKNKSYNYGF